MTNGCNSLNTYQARFVNFKISRHWRAVTGWSQKVVVCFVSAAVSNGKTCAKRLPIRNLQKNYRKEIGKA